MSYKQIATKLQQEFPELDLTQSVVTDVLHAHQNNKEQAKKHLQQFQVQLLGEKQEKVYELEQQFQLPREVIVDTLERNNWNVEAAIMPLFMQFEEMVNKQNAEAQQQREAQLKNQPKPADDSPFTSVIKVNNEKESPFRSAIAASTSSNQRQVTMVAKPEMIDTGNQITVEWEMMNGKTSSYDWIGLFAADQPNKNYMTYEWRGKEENKGTVTFTAPSTFGYYEFRYIPSGSYEHIAISNQIKVGPVVDLTAHLDKAAKKVSVKWDKKSGNPYPRAWVGLYEKSEINNKNYIHWQYTTEPFTEALFTAPIKPGDYEFRYFPYGYVDTSRSNTLVVEGHDTLVASIGNDNTVTAKVSVVTVDPYYDGVWIGLYLKSEKDNKNLKRYKYITDRETEVSFRAPEAGEYEFRLFAKKSYETILASNPIIVQGLPK